MSLENWLRLLCDDWLRGQQQIRIEKNWGLVFFAGRREALENSEGLASSTKNLEVVSCTDKAIPEIEPAETKSRL